jgi:hypothetical protein
MPILDTADFIRCHFTTLQSHTLSSLSFRYLGPHHFTVRLSVFSTRQYISCSLSFASFLSFLVRTLGTFFPSAFAHDTLGHHLSITPYTFSSQHLTRYTFSSQHLSWYTLPHNAPSSLLPHSTPEGVVPVGIEPRTQGPRPYQHRALTTEPPHRSLGHLPHHPLLISPFHG